MRTALAILPLAALAAGASVAAAPKQAANRHADQCIQDFNFGNPRPLPDGRLLFPSRPSSDRSYAATFKGGRCPGMHEMSTIIVDRFSGAQICEGDKVRALDPLQTIPGPICVIDHFDRYTEPPRAGR